MQAHDAIAHAARFASLQGRLVQRFMEAYEPRDRERFRDVPNGTLLLDGVAWMHRRHGAGVLFVDPDGVRVNAHVGMAEFPEAIDDGRLFEYFDSLHLSSVALGGREYPIESSAMIGLVADMVRAGLVRRVVTNESFPHEVWVFENAQAAPTNAQAAPT